MLDTLVLVHLSERVEVIGMSADDSEINLQLVVPDPVGWAGTDRVVQVEPSELYSNVRSVMLDAIADFEAPKEIPKVPAA